MTKRCWISLSLLIAHHSLFAATPTMQLSTQPTGAAYSLPISFGITSVAPIPQNICGATITTPTESATCSGLPVCKNTTAKTASFSCAVTTTCNSTVSAKGSCNISVSVTKPATIAAATPFSFQLSYGSYNALLTSNGFRLNGTNPSPPASSYRTITFTNSCNYTIWFGSISGAAPTSNILSSGAIDCTGGSGNAGKLACVAAGGACYARIGNTDACFSQVCTTDSDCLTGASCYVKSGAVSGTCFWNNPTPITNPSFQLNQGSSNTLQIPQYASNGIGAVWSGAFGGRTGCASGTCTSALCTTGTENAQGVCSLGVGFQQPATQAEPTFITFPTGSSPTPTDAYDVTVINGANVPMSMYPTNVSLPLANTNPYICGAPGYNNAVPIGGASTTQTTIAASNWQLASSTNWLSGQFPTSIAYRYVVPTSTNPSRCAADTDCISSEYCGLTYSDESIGSTTKPGSGYLVCGTFAGWFTADQICGTNNDFTTALDKNGATVMNFACNTPIPQGPTGTMSNLYQCNGNYATSCYSAGASSNSCCGCIDWYTANPASYPIISVASNYVTSCNSIANPTWTGSLNLSNQPQVIDTIYYLKQSCPSCYVYPFDDKSSSFTCTKLSNSENAVNYTITFCPGGNGNTGFQPPAH